MLKPVMTASRELFHLDGVWDFTLDAPDQGVSAGYFRAPLPAARPMPVPASFNEITTEVEVREHVGPVWYQRRATAPRYPADERLILRFGSVTHDARVWVNDAEVASHVGGYLPFEADITDLVSPGAEFTVTVRVDNRLSWQSIPPGYTHKNDLGTVKQRYYHDFFNYAGIHRSVVLYTRPAVAVDDVTVVTEIDGAAGVVNYRVQLTGGDAPVSVELLDAEGNKVAEASGAEGQLRVENAKFWFPGAAYLYKLVVRAGADVYPLNVGIRTVRVENSQILINNKPVYLRGYGRHEDNIVRGKAHDPVMMVHDFEIMKWQGANSFRTSHYPYDEEVLDYADREGFMVIDETAAVGLNTGIGGGLFGMGDAVATFSPETANEATQAVHKSQIQELIARDKNHPSVIIWSIANEPESNTQAARDYFKPLAEAARAADPTRPIGYVNVMFCGPDKETCAEFFDVLMLNRYQGWYIYTGDLPNAEKVMEDELNEWIRRYPGKPVLYTEYGPDAMPGLRDFYKQPWSEDFQIEMLSMFHRVFDRHPEVVCEQMWNFADFMTVAGVARVGGNKKGMFTRDRRPKAAAYEVRKRWLEMRERLGH